MRDYSSSPSNAAKKFLAYVSLSNNFERSSEAAFQPKIWFCFQKSLNLQSFRNIMR